LNKLQRDVSMMKRILKILLVALLISVAAAPFQAQASPNQSPDEGLRQYWRSGFILQSSPKYSGMMGKGASLAVQFRSDRHSDVYFVFPAVSGKPLVRQASYYLLSRSGAYSGDATLTLEIYNFNGVLQCALSASHVDLQTAPIQTWTTITLGENVDNRSLQPGEVLVFHLALDGSAGGNLDVRPIFDVAVEPVVLTYLQFYFPLAMK